MTRLIEKQAKRIASLFNLIVVAEAMMRKYPQSYELWLVSRNEAAQKLIDEFGITPVGVELPKEAVVS